MRGGHPPLPVRMRAEHQAELAALAEQRGMTRSGLIREALARYLGLGWPDEPREQPQLGGD